MREEGKRKERKEKMRKKGEKRYRRERKEREKREEEDGGFRVLKSEFIAFSIFQKNFVLARFKTKF